ncbi:VWA domain-containing protein [Aureibacter tunicatorum]|uniref:Ca-activated chloride channel family protein n=1 Tax=Aureibacter tunicatorum TaxID=866807 RepID=A0AAE3XHY9_9BACT|nr:VWA domain-containing protein [Aureibacter tunicatorum]MDR6238041.1 Ca-activated chloride channel family protein [Aureibacter tunicatorum]BDD03074.1 membrane protein [Aureibacter tunicatorum]
MPDNLEFAHIWVFVLLPLPILIYWLMPPLRMKSSSLSFPNFKKTSEYSGQKPKKAASIKKKNAFIYLMLFIIWSVLIVALAAPELVGKPELKIKESRNFLIVADISFSMAQTDWVVDGQKVRRWDAVKNVIHDFIGKREGDRMGLIFFGSDAFIQAPFTPDLEVVSKMLDEADVGMAGQRTMIGKAIVKGVEMFKEDTIQSKVMLVLTDGIDAGVDIQPLDAAEIAKSDSIQIYTIGIGDPSRPESDLDEETLKDVAELTEAKYFLGTDTEELEKVYAELDELEPIEYEEESYVPRTPLYQFPLAIAVLLMLLFGGLGSLVSLFKKIKN